MFYKYIYFYLSSTLPLQTLYQTSTKHLLKFSSRLLTIGDRDPLDIPILGIIHSHTGNIIFPRWEYLIR